MYCNKEIVSVSIIFRDLCLTKLDCSSLSSLPRINSTSRNDPTAWKCWDSLAWSTLPSYPWIGLRTSPLRGWPWGWWVTSRWVYFISTSSAVSTRDMVTSLECSWSLVLSSRPSNSWLRRSNNDHKSKIVESCSSTALWLSATAPSNCRLRLALSSRKSWFLHLSPTGPHLFYCIDEHRIVSASARWTWWWCLSKHRRRRLVHQWDPCWSYRVTSPVCGFRIVTIFEYGALADHYLHHRTSHHPHQLFMQTFDQLLLPLIVPK